MSKINQRIRIIKYIQDFGSITTKEAFTELGVACLPKRISELKKEGYSFDKKPEKGRNRYGEPVNFLRYSLIDDV